MIVWDLLENRRLFSAAFDLIGLTALRKDPAFTSIDGSGVSVAVLDTGLDITHPLIAPNYLAGYDAITGGSKPTVMNPHGTHVAGIIGSIPDSSRGYEGGVAPKVGLIGINVFQKDSSGDVSASNRSIEAGLQWVLDHRAQYHIVAVNMSLGEGIFTSPDQVAGDVYVDEIQRLEDAGVTVVSAAGNSYGIITDPSSGRQVNVEFPNSGSPGIVSTLDVGAVWDSNDGDHFLWGSGSVDVTTGADRVTSFSQRPPPGVGNSIFAPGAIITSTWPGNQLQAEQGTSQASPMVAGAVALVQDAAQTFGGRLLSVDEVRSIIQSTGDSIVDGDDEDDAVFIDSNGNGQVDSGELHSMTDTGLTYARLNVYRAVQAVKAMFSNGADPNGVLAGAVIGPALDGSTSSSLTGTIGSDGSKNVGAKDVDLYRFTVTAGGQVTITLGTNSANPKNFNTYLRIFDSGGNQIATDDDSAGSGFSQVTITLAAGTYYAGVSGAPNSNYNPSSGSGAVSGATGNFQITFNLVGIDPNGTIAGAVNVNLSDPSQGPQIFNGLIGQDFGQPVGTEDVDFFKIVAPDNGKLMFDVDTPFASQFVDSYLRVFDANGQLLGSNDDSVSADSNGSPTELTDGTFDYDADTQSAVGHASDSFVSGNVFRGQVYYVGVSDTANRNYDPDSLSGRSSAGPGGFYNVSITFVNNDLNGDIAHAVTLATPSGTVSGTIGKDGAQDVGDHDVDLFSVTPVSDGLLEIDVNSYSITGNSDPVNSVLRVFDSTGKLLASDDDTNGPDPFLRISVKAGQTYYFGLSGFGNGSYDPSVLGSGSPGDTGDYQFSTRLLSTSKVSALWDDKIGSSAIKTLKLGSQINASVGMDNGGLVRGSKDVDLYKFVAPASGLIEARARTQTAFGADTVLRAFDSSGKELTHNDNSSSSTVDSRIQFSVTKGKTYYIGVSGAGKSPLAYLPAKGTGATSGSTGDYVVALDGEFASVSGGVLTVTGTSNGDRISISKSGSNYHVKRNGSVLSVATSGIKSLLIKGNGGNDTIAVGSGVVAASIDGGSGNDTLKGGQGNDTITGGSGKDALYGNGGTDKFLARDSVRDLIYGGDGKDTAQVDGSDYRNSIASLLA